MDLVDGTNKFSKSFSFFDFIILFNFHVALNSFFFSFFLRDREKTIVDFIQLNHFVQ